MSTTLVKNLHPQFTAKPSKKTEILCKALPEQNKDFT